MNEYIKKFVKIFGWRHVQVLLMFFYHGIGFTQKVNLSVGIVAMTDNSHNSEFPELDWDQVTSGLVLSSLFWGYALAPIPAGIIAHRFGPKYLLLVVMIIASILTILIPTLAHQGWEYVCAARFFIGLMQGFGLPCIYTALSKWVHPHERSLSVSIVYAGGNIGVICTLAISGQIAASSLGWPAIFYLSGGMGLIYSVFWFMYGSDSPDDCKRVSKDEIAYIQSMTTTAGGNVKRNNVPTPWRKIFTSIPFWSLLFAHLAGSWSFYLLMTEIPSYINGVMDFNIKTNSLLSALPYVVMFILGLVLSFLSDFLIKNQYLSIGVTRKIFNSIGMYIPIPFLIVLGYTTDIQLAIIFLTLAVGITAGNNCGFLSNHLDLTPNFAGTLMGFTTGASNVMSILGPLLTGVIVTNTADQSLWRIIFFVTAAIFFVCNGIFVLFGSGDVQKWNHVSTDEGKTNEKEDRSIELGTELKRVEQSS